MSIQVLKELILPVCDTATQAGKVIIKYYKSKMNILLKDDKSPITQADLESNQLIKNSASHVLPEPGNPQTNIFIILIYWKQ